MFSRTLLWMLQICRAVDPVYRLCRQSSKGIERSTGLTTVLLMDEEKQPTTTLHADEKMD